VALKTMRRTTGDNDYLHRDFHGALSVGIEYLHTRYGEGAVREYLWQFTRKFYAPLTREVKARGLAAIEEHLRTTYERESGTIHITKTVDELLVDVAFCPAVKHMRESGYPVARLFRETIDTVNRAICHETPFAAQLLAYDEQTGRCIQRFYRSET
jgi:hypothetical protein